MKRRKDPAAADLKRQGERARILCEQTEQLVHRTRRTALERVRTKLELAATLLWVAQGRKDYPGWVRCKQAAQSVCASATQFLAREALHPGDQQYLWAKLESVRTALIRLSEAAPELEDPEEIGAATPALPAAPPASPDPNAAMGGPPLRRG